MLCNVSYNNKEIHRKINEMIGLPYSFKERILKRGIGSPRLLIGAASPEIDELLNRVNQRRYANIELRPNGIIVGFRCRLESYALVIPFHQMTIYKSESHQYSIYGPTHFVTVMTEVYDKPIHPFMKKLMGAKTSASGLRIEDV